MAPAPSAQTAQGISATEAGVSAAQRDTGGSSSTRTAASQSAIITLSKAYTSDTDKYSGNFGDNFEYKSKIFNNRCDMMGVEMEDRGNAIPVTKPALNFYFDFVLGKVSTYSGIIQKLRERFLTPESVRDLVSEFENLTVQTVARSNAKKTTTQCLNLIVARL